LSETCDFSCQRCGGERTIFLELELALALFAVSLSPSPILPSLALWLRHDVLLLFLELWAAACLRNEYAVQVVALQECAATGAAWPLLAGWCLGRQSDAVVVAAFAESKSRRPPPSGERNGHTIGFRVVFSDS